jgi:hypothetical protein
MNEVALRLAVRLFDVPLIQNQYRSAFVEAMIEPRLGGAGWKYVGDGWSGWDFEHPDGGKLELKQSTAIQTWSASRGLRTRGAFDIASRSGGYFYESGAKWQPGSGRFAHAYVFAWHGTDDEKTADHRDPDQWEFYVIGTSLLPEQKTISLSKVRRLALANRSGPTPLYALVRSLSPFSRVLPDILNI